MQHKVCMKCCLNFAPSDKTMNNLTLFSYIHILVVCTTCFNENSSAVWQLFTFWLSSCSLTHCIYDFTLKHRNATCPNYVVTFKLCYYSILQTVQKNSEYNTHVFGLNINITAIIQQMHSLPANVIQIICSEKSIMAYHNNCVIPINNNNKQHNLFIVLTLLVLYDMIQNEVNAERRVKVHIPCCAQTVNVLPI